MSEQPQTTPLAEAPTLLGGAGAEAASKTVEVKEPTVETSEVKTEEVKKDTPGKTEEAKKDEGVPEKYEFQVAEGKTLNPEATTEFEAVAKELKLNKESAQKIVDIAVKHFGSEGEKVLNDQAAQWKEVNTKWVEQVKADKDFGGTKFEESRAHVTRALIKFAGPDIAEVNKVLNTGWGNNPALFKMFARIGKAMAEDKFVDGAENNSPGTIAKTLYPNQP